MRSIRHWTPRYLIDRARVAATERQHPDWPWFPADAVRLLDQLLRPDDSGLEWGAGRSTVWFSGRVARLVSVEHDPRWHARVATRLAAEGRSNVDLRLCAWIQHDEESPDAARAPYVAVADEFAPQSLDFVCVDGVHRSACALAAFELIRPGGLLILDNANWYLPSNSRAPGSLPQHASPRSARWRSFLERTRGARQLWTGNGVSDTAIWILVGEPARALAGQP